MDACRRGAAFALGPTVTRSTLALLALAALACGTDHAPDRPRAPEDAGSFDADHPDAEVSDAGSPDAAPPPSCAVPWRDVQLGTSASDEALALVTWGDTVVVGGYLGGRARGASIIPAGDSRGFVAGFDLAGRERWRQVIDTPGSDTVEALLVGPAAQPAEGLWVAGRTTGTLPGQRSAGQFDLFVAWLSPTSGFGPAVQAGNDGPQHPRRMTWGGSDQLLVAGYDEAFIPSNYVERWEDPFFARFVIERDAEAPRAVLSTFATLGTSWTDFGWGLGALTTGAPESDEGDVILSGGGARGPFVQRLGRDGEPRWSAPLLRSALDAVTVVLTSTSGRLWVAGSAFARYGEVAYGEQDAFLLELDPATGQTLSATQVGTAQSEWVEDGVMDADGNVYLAGDTLGSFFGAPAGDHDLFVVKLGPDGQPLAAWSGGTPADDHLAAITLDACGRVLIAGYTEGALVPGSTSGDSGDRDAFIIAPELTPWPALHGR